MKKRMIWKREGFNGGLNLYMYIFPPISALQISAFSLQVNATDVKVLATALVLPPLDIPVKDWSNYHILPQTFLQYFKMTHWIETEL